MKVSSIILTLTALLIQSSQTSWAFSISSCNSISKSSQSSFIINPSSFSTRPSTALHAKKVGGGKVGSKRKNHITTGGGFGKSNNTADNNPSSSSSKTRSVSGYTGSGTKPLRTAANTFDTIRKKYGKEAIIDVYVRSPLNDAQLCWFVGKVIRVTDTNDSELFHGSTIPTETETILSQKRLILEYAKNQLRPQNFGGPYSQQLELWMAPGDTEMDVVQNKISLVKVTGSVSDLSDGFSVKDVGYNPEIYVGDEQNDGGLRVKRDENGHPVKAVFEIQ